MNQSRGLHRYHDLRSRENIDEQTTNGFILVTDSSPNSIEQLGDIRRSFRPTGLSDFAKQDRAKRAHSFTFRFQSSIDDSTLEAFVLDLNLD